MRVQVQHVEGKVRSSHPLSDLRRLGSGRVGDLRLPEAERPVRRHVRPTGQLGVGTEHLAQVTDEHEDIEPVVVHGHLELGRGTAADPGSEPGIMVGEHTPARRGDPERHVLVGPRRDRAERLLPDVWLPECPRDLLDLRSVELIVRKGDAALNEGAKIGGRRKPPVGWIRSASAGVKSDIEGIVWELGGAVQRKLVHAHAPVPPLGIPWTVETLDLGETRLGGVRSND